MKRVATILAILAMAAVFIGCPKKDIRTAEGEMDTPQHHVEMGDRFARDGNWEGAHREYGLALGLDPNYVPALVGEMLYFAQAGNGEEADKMRSRAESKAKSKADKFEYFLGMVRYHAFIGGSKWIKRSEEAYEKALKLNSGDERLYFYMGWAYKQALMFSQAESMYKKVIEMDGSLRLENHPEGGAVAFLGLPLANT